MKVENEGAMIAVERGVVGRNNPGLSIGDGTFLFWIDISQISEATLRSVHGKLWIRLRARTGGRPMGDNVTRPASAGGRELGDGIGRMLDGGFVSQGDISSPTTTSRVAEREKVQSTGIKRETKTTHYPS